uniref:Ribosomal protein eL8/eL30/eS12/Gadd45 domain-containing protein n=1 Tax=Globisporangium ultimum (strain ATCC 200006 / CBS 805.95 / DAOM BR144) TaxID=431595 RepID=K3XA03_GLOUD
KRGVLAKKICLLIVGTDIEQCDVLDEKLDEILAIATKQEVPIIYPMSRRKLGRVLSKSVRVSCVGVYSMEGANDLFQDILKFA